MTRAPFAFGESIVSAIIQGFPPKVYHSGETRQFCLYFKSGAYPIIMASLVAALADWPLNFSGLNGQAAVQSASLLCIRGFPIMYLRIPMGVHLVITLILSRMDAERANERLKTAE